MNKKTMIAVCTALFVSSVAVAQSTHKVYGHKATRSDACSQAMEEAASLASELGTCHARQCTDCRASRNSYGTIWDCTVVVADDKSQCE